MNREIRSEMFVEATEDGLVAIKLPNQELTYYTPSKAELFSHKFKPWFRNQIVGAVNEAKKNSR